MSPPNSRPNGPAKTPGHVLNSLVQHHLRGQQLLESLGADLPSSTLTPAQVRLAPQGELQKHPALWAAFIRGWEACMTSVPAPPPLPNRPPSRPFVRQPAPNAGRSPWQQGTPRHTVAKTPSTLPASSTPTTVQSTPAVPTVNRLPEVSNPEGKKPSTSALSAKRKTMIRFNEYRKMRRRENRLQANVSQQYRVTKPPPQPAARKTPVPAPRTHLPEIAKAVEGEDVRMDVTEQLDKDVDSFLTQPLSDTT